MHKTIQLCDVEALLLIPSIAVSTNNNGSLKVTADPGHPVLHLNDKINTQAWSLHPPSIPNDTVPVSQVHSSPSPSPGVCAARPELCADRYQDRRCWGQCSSHRSSLWFHQHPLKEINIQFKILQTDLTDCVVLQRSNWQIICHIGQTKPVPGTINFSIKFQWFTKETIPCYIKLVWQACIFIIELNG